MSAALFGLLWSKMVLFDLIRPDGSTKDKDKEDKEKGKDKKIRIEKASRPGCSKSH